MNKTINILTGLLVAQIALAVALRSTDTTFGGRGSDKKFIAIDFNTVNKITLQENKAGKLVLEKDKNGWVLPSLNRYPASLEGVNRLVDKLKEQTRVWPVATTADAAPRFRVSPDDFAETITLSGSAGDTIVYLGSSSGHNRMHARVDKDNDIISLEIPQRQLSTSAEDWIDRDAVHFKKDDVVSLQLPQFTLEKKDKDWQLSHDGRTDLVDIGAGDEVVDDAGGVNVSAVLGKEDKPEYGLSAPAFSFTVKMKNGQSNVYNFSKMKEGNFYVLKPSNFEFYTKVDSWFVDRLKESNAAALLKKSEVLRKAKESTAKKKP